MANLLGQQATVFPSHHGGFLGGEFGYAGQPVAFARKLRGPRRRLLTVVAPLVATRTWRVVRTRRDMPLWTTSLRLLVHSQPSILHQPT
jgi:hypothetical protein